MKTAILVHGLQCTQTFPRARQPNGLRYHKSVFEHLWETGVDELIGAHDDPLERFLSLTSGVTPIWVCSGKMERDITKRSTGHL